MIQNLASGVRAFTSNAFLVTGETTALVDAGANFDVVARIEAQVDELDRVYLTHTHPDHVKNLPAIREAFDVETWGYDPENEYVDNAIADGETVQIGDDDYVALHTPGHKPDHLCLYAREAGICFAGDLVFENGGFGRTDLEGGDRETLIRSIDALLDTLDDDLAALHVGHGPSITERPIDDVELAARAARM
ncbi:MBL fold metallo-hydrolase [Halobellus sp. Atlit-38R]|jgi:glyoxylase-like metal-dependent hydrolase (beta-lactamase superfamily II)|uniref:MBL fold metallo-hydrolase n=1 Tax=Halobellus sp. Atlit-38R TaxID=2282131 RepID=UPI000EF1E560|nr:MBL fold metallo-hydrolase [Halobellus sp. Atlit-38R]RLM94794.1 MBL fold metallo-hydrolase [Halobellus sp. Atlit-38R]